MSRLAGATLLLQVLFALGAGMLLMIPLRRLPAWALVAVGVGWFLVGEWITGAFWDPPALPEPLWISPLVAVLQHEGVMILYPAIPWTAMMAIGWGLGRWLRHEQVCGRGFPTRTIAMLGVGLLLAFVVVRGINGYGNMFLLRGDDSIVQWLHVSKYPPSLAYALLELGLLALGLAIASAIERRVRVRSEGPLLVFGQTALFFYLLHFPLLGGAALGLGLFQRAGLAETYVATIVVLALLYPVCRWYRGVKQRKPESVLRYI